MNKKIIFIGVIAICFLFAVILLLWAKSGEVGGAKITNVDATVKFETHESGTIAIRTELGSSEKNEEDIILLYRNVKYATEILGEQYVAPYEDSSEMSIERKGNQFISTHKFHATGDNSSIDSIGKNVFLLYRKVSVEVIPFCSIPPCRAYSVPVRNSYP